jgi:hypothetical protein
MLELRNGGIGIKGDVGIPNSGIQVSRIRNKDSGIP